MNADYFVWVSLGFGVGSIHIIQTKKPKQNSVGTQISWSKILKKNFKKFGFLPKYFGSFGYGYYILYFKVIDSLANPKFPRE